MGIKVEQYDLEDNLLCSYNSYADAAKVLGVNESTVRRSAKFGRTVKGEYYFMDEEKKDDVEIQINGLYELDKPLEFETEPIEIQAGPKILVLDIETAPLKAYSWGVWKQNISPDKLMSNDWFILSIAAKWLNSDAVMADRLSPMEALVEDDERLVSTLYEWLDEADIVVAHNGNMFDIPRINTRFLLSGFMPPSPYRQIDTLISIKQMFNFPYNSLNFVAQQLGVGEKDRTEFSLWDRCSRGDDCALEYMMQYNKKDVVILEKVYLKIRPFMKNHPNLDLYLDIETTACPHCGKTSLRMLHGKYFYTQAAKYQVYRCDYCDSLSRSKVSEKFINKRKISAIPK